MPLISFTPIHLQTFIRETMKRADRPNGGVRFNFFLSTMLIRDRKSRTRGGPRDAQNLSQLAAVRRNHAQLYQTDRSNDSREILVSRE